MSIEEAELSFRLIRWAATDGRPVCPHCGYSTVYEARRPNGASRYRCKDFGVTSGTLFASHLMPLRNYLAAIAVFCNEVKGKSALALSRDLGVQHKIAFVLAHKLREAMASELKGMTVGGPDKTVETDGGYFVGYVKTANYKDNHRDRRLAKNQNGKRQVVVVIRECEGRTLPTVLKSESAALEFITSRVAKGTERSWLMKPRHGTICKPGSRCNAHHHHIAGAYLVRYAQKAAWREDHRRLDNGQQVQGVMGLAMNTGRQWTGAGTGSGRGGCDSTLCGLW